jgi:hypothetical protein
MNRKENYHGSIPGTMTKSRHAAVLAKPEQQARSTGDVIGGSVEGSAETMPDHRPEHHRRQH